MPRRSRRLRVLQLALECAGLAALLAALWLAVSWLVALAVFGLVLLAAAQVVEKVL